MIQSIVMLYFLESSYQYSILYNTHCGGSSIETWANGDSSNYGTVEGVLECQKICDLHKECAGFVARYDNICGFWKQGNLDPHSFENHNCYVKPRKKSYKTLTIKYMEI